jgi:hypothetical protein
MRSSAVEYTIEFSGSPQDVTITTYGPASRDGLVGFVQDLVDDPRFRPGMFVLVDHLALDATTINGDDIRAQAQRVINLEEELGPCTLAIVVPTPLAFGYARMYELHTAETQIHSRVIYNRHDGLAWLDAKRQAHERRSTERALVREASGNII